MDDAPKTFTVDEANASLDQVRPLVEQLQGLQQSIVEATGKLNEAANKLSQGNGYPIQDIKDQLRELTQHQMNLVEAFHSTLEQLEDLGALLKDLSRGLVDFYSARDGAQVLLCWQLGESRVGFWHGLEEGFTGRRPL